ncbi:ABC transporter substrate-binding protein [Mesonia sp.]|uniref:ABC transporter substrate-binding protein n=1 Tax=Mesonia sp. TaxID=1960830 RepID=UPI003F94F6EB
MKNILFILSLLIIVSCKEQEQGKKETKKIASQGKEVAIDYANGFSITNYGDYKIIKVNSPWPKAEEEFTYVLAEKGVELPADLSFNQRVTIPVEKMVVTSTTHIPSLESLGVQNTLVGFPNTKYVSSKKTRALIDEGKVKELGKNEAINTEVLLDIQPDVVIGFAMESGNKTFNIIQKNGIPVIYNGDWVEADPLGKAEWIKFFGAFYNKEDLASNIFNDIETSYNEAKKLAASTKQQPSVLCGSMYKDVWYLPYGDSWQAKFIKDAHAKYIYSDTQGSGSISMAFESVLENAQDADFWIAPGSFTAYETMTNASEHYDKFEAFQKKEIYSYAGVLGETGGALYYELAPNRPDLVLKDLIKIFHPDLLPNYETTFFKPLD